jgi:hypothetical protein
MNSHLTDFLFPGSLAVRARKKFQMHEDGKRKNIFFKEKFSCDTQKSESSDRKTGE